MRIRFIVSALGAGVVALAVGCGGGQGGGHGTTPGVPTATSTVAPTLALNRIDELILAPDVVSDIVGAKLNWASKPPPGATRPQPPIAVDEGNPECAALMGPAADTVGVVYTAWRSNQYRDNDTDTFEHAVYQAVATVPDSKAATQLLDTAFIKAVNSCDNAVLHRKDGQAQWRYQKSDATGTDARWTATQLQDGRVVGWICSNEARAKNNVVVYVQVCQYGNGAPAATTIVDKISEKVPG